MMTKTVLTTVFGLVCLPSAVEAQTKDCTISVVGGAWKGQTYGLRIENGKFVGTSGILESDLPGCVAKKHIFGRWYHLCRNNRIIVFKRKNNRWKRLSAKSLKKYRHNCL